MRYLIRFADGQTVETVWMPEGDGGEQGDGSGQGEGRSRATICLSSQAGCAVNCGFCMTALLGLQRNLTAGEIVGQVLMALGSRRGGRARQDQSGLHGPGRAFLNYEKFMKAVRLLVEGGGLAESRMTVSTSGILPRFADFAREPMRPKLAISLNGIQRRRPHAVMPINRKWNIASLIQAARSFPLRPRERLTFEYVLLNGENDSVENAQEVTAPVARTACKGQSDRLESRSRNRFPRLLRSKCSTFKRC